MYLLLYTFLTPLLSCTNNSTLSTYYSTIYGCERSEVDNITFRFHINYGSTFSIIQTLNNSMTANCSKAIFVFVKLQSILWCYKRILWKRMWSIQKWKKERKFYHILLKWCVITNNIFFRRDYDIPKSFHTLGLIHSETESKVFLFLTS